MQSTTLSRRIQEVGPHGGRSLHELILHGEGPDRATLVDWGCQLLEILTADHGRGVLHRHLTEDDVIVTPEGRVVLAGFGLTRRVFAHPVSPPPEVLADKPYTARSDLYAVGSLLRRLAFGAGALRGGRGSFGARDPLLKVLARATYTDPAGRYGTAAEMADALREAGRRELPRRQARSAQAGAQVRSFPGASLRLVPAHGEKTVPRKGEDDDLRHALALLVGTLVLLAIVLASGWFLLAQNDAAWLGGRSAAATAAPPVSPPPAAAAP